MSNKYQATGNVQRAIDILVSFYQVMAKTSAISFWPYSPIRGLISIAVIFTD
jgi:hypothetical protein